MIVLAIKSIVIPISAYVERSDGNFFVQIDEDKNGLEVKHNLDVENGATIEVKHRVLMLGDIRLILDDNELKAYRNDGRCIALRRDEKKFNNAKATMCNASLYHSKYVSYFTEII